MHGSLVNWLTRVENIILVGGRNCDRKWNGRQLEGTREIGRGTGAMSDEIIHLEEVIRRKRIRFGDASDQPRVFSENCFERCFPVPVEASPRNFRSESLENLETEFTAKLGNSRDFERGEKLDVARWQVRPWGYHLRRRRERKKRAYLLERRVSSEKHEEIGRNRSSFLVKLISFFFLFLRETHS